MATGDGNGRDPHELDPFAGDDYDPHWAMALAAKKQGAEFLAEVERRLAEALEQHGELTNWIAASARKSANAQLAEMRALAAEAQRFEQEARGYEPGTAEYERSVESSVDAMNRMVPSFNELMFTLAKIPTPDPAPRATPQPLAPTLHDPKKASQMVFDQLMQWMGLNPNGSGAMVIVNATPGVGKTHAMMRVALQMQANGERVVIAVRTKEMVVGAHPETVERLHALSPMNRVHLAVITGRDETNCYRHQAVEAAQAHGYMPGQAVCLGCEHYPDNALRAGFPVCPYFEARMRAHNLSRGARFGRHRYHPLVLTTHASVPAAYATGGGRWGAQWSSDAIMFDEDPTEAMEVDVILAEEQCDFESTDPALKEATDAARMFRRAIEIGRRERDEARVTGFKAPGSDRRNTHPVHTEYDSHYVGRDLHRVLEQACMELRNQHKMLGAMRTLGDVSHGGGFSVQPGELVDVTTVDDIHTLDVPPRALSRLADGIHAEMNHAVGVDRLLHDAVRGRAASAMTAAEMRAQQRSSSAADFLSYIARLECMPADPENDRPVDEWRFVLRDHLPFANTSAKIIIGDAYAQQAHYEYLFDRSSDNIDVVSTLHPDAVITRILDDGCGINELRKGFLGRVLSMLEAHMIQHVRPGDRVLIYGHKALKTKVMPWFEGMGERLEVAEYAYEHWWGGRGKDRYGRWEHTYTISDPIQSISGLTHVANARAWRTARRARDDAEKVEHTRQVQIASQSVRSHGLVSALRNAHWRITLEHDRQNVSELTQAMHRSRPVHHPTRITVVGEMEQSRDLVAQCVTVAPSDYRKARTVASRTRKFEGTISAFVTPAELLLAARAVVDWYGIFSPYFLHAFTTVTLESALGGVAIHDNTISEIVNDSESSSVALIVNELEGHGRSYPDALVDPRVPGPAVPGAVLLPSEPARSPTEAAPENASPFQAVIERIWNPPPYWAMPVPRAVMKTLTSDSLTGMGLKVLTRVPKASWDRSRRKRPNLYYDPAVLSGEDRPDEALAIYREIVDRQYGPLGDDGRLVRPRFNPKLPSSRRAVPF